MSDDTQAEQARRRTLHAPLPVPPAPTAPALAAPRATNAAGEEDPRTRAARRALELREHGSINDEGSDEFYIDPRVIPDGWSYEFKRLTVLGAPDPSYEVALALKGWEPVPASRHPEMMPASYRGNTIERKGMLLMERPAEITNEIKARDYRNARDQVGQKEAQLYGSPAGPNSPFAPDNKGARLNTIKRDYEPISVPK
jgi:hypothetical protein